MRDSLQMTDLHKMATLLSDPVKPIVGERLRMPALHCRLARVIANSAYLSIVKLLLNLVSTRIRRGQRDCQDLTRRLP